MRERWKSAAATANRFSDCALRESSATHLQNFLNQFRVKYLWDEIPERQHSLKHLWESQLQALAPLFRRAKSRCDAVLGFRSEYLNCTVLSLPRSASRNDSDLGRSWTTVMVPGMAVTVRTKDPLGESWKVIASACPAWRSGATRLLTAVASAALRRLKRLALIAQRVMKAANFWYISFS